MYAVSPIMAVITAVVFGRIKNVPVFVWGLDLWSGCRGGLRQLVMLALVGRVVSAIYNCVGEAARIIEE
jgi:hypothetical protein